MSSRKNRKKKLVISDNNIPEKNYINMKGIPKKRVTVKGRWLSLTEDPNN